MFNIIGADGQKYGPVSAEQLRQWIAEGRVNAQTRAQAEGSAEWKPLGQFPELASLFGAAGVPAAPTPATQPKPTVPNYLVQAIFVTLCCCLPFGIPAIVFAAQVNGKLATGDIAGAMESSRKAKMWCWVSFGLGIVSSVIGFLAGILGGLPHRGGN